MKVLLIGSSGIVGSGVARYFLDQSDRLIAVSRKRPDISGDGMEFCPIDLLENSSTERLVDLIDESLDGVIYNAGLLPARTSQPSFSDMCNVNVRGLEVLLNHIANHHPLLPVVHISGFTAMKTLPDINESLPYTNPNSYYTTKVFAELVCNQYRLSSELAISNLRISAPFGYDLSVPSVLPIFLKKALSNQDIVLQGSGTRQQTFTFSEDIGFACKKAIDVKFSGALNMTSDFRYTMHELAEKIVSSIDGCQSKIIFSGDTDPQEGAESFVDISKAKNQIGYYPLFSFETAIRRVVDVVRGVRL